MSMTNYIGEASESITVPQYKFVESYQDDTVPSLDEMEQAAVEANDVRGLDMVRRMRLLDALKN